MKWLILLIIATFIPMSYAQTEVDKDFGDKDRQGLKYVKDISHAFIKRHNNKYGTKWQALEPDARLMVGKCQVPLKARWVKIRADQTFYSNNVKVWHIGVSCSRIVKHSHFERKSWDILVPTTRPILKTKHYQK